MKQCMMAAKCRLWTEECMHAAVESIKEGKGLRQTAVESIKEGKGLRQTAVESIKEGKGLRQTARLYNEPVETLQRRADGMQTTSCYNYY